jgi:hypothetical protein
MARIVRRMSRPRSPLGVRRLRKEGRADMPLGT